MKFTQLFTIASLTTLAVATPTGGGDHAPPGPNDRCCEETTTASDPDAAKALGAIGVILQDLDVIVGLNCSPITVVGDNNGW